jgi:hypothetical protein
VSAILLLAWLAAADGGTPTSPPAKTALSADDAELVKNLELLEAFEDVKDLDMLEELSVER